MDRRKVPKALYGSCGSLRAGACASMTGEDAIAR